MRERKAVGARVQFVFQRIKQGNYPNANTLAKEYEVSSKTIKRDIEYLKDMLGVPIEYDGAKHGYQLSEPTFDLPALKIGEGELFALALAEQVLEQYQNTPVYEQLTKVFHKLEDHLPENASLEANWLWGRFSMVPLPSPSIDQNVWKTVFESLHNDRKLAFEYTAPPYQKGVPKILRPYHVVVHRAQWYIIGLDETRDSIRIFSLSRIRHPRVKKDFFQRPEDFNIRDFIDPEMGVFMGGERVKVRIHFSSKVAALIGERLWHPNQVLNHQDDGSVILELETNQQDEILFWVAAWGPEARILTPTSLAEKMKERLQEALENY